MKVIVAGFSKTGTKSMTAALTLLGFSVRDFVDHFWLHDRQWEEILSGEAPPGVFRSMYEDVDAVVGSPVFLFWEEIAREFPDAKIILTTRDEDSFYLSQRRQAEALAGNSLYVWTQLLSPTGWRYFKYYRRCMLAVSGVYMESVFDYSYGRKEMLLRRSFRQHQAYCQQNAPRERMLVYNVKQGWAPLCEFLGASVPRAPFPRENVGGNLMDKMMSRHPAMIRMKREAAAAVALLAVVGACAVYKLWRAPPSAWICSMT